MTSLRQPIDFASSGNVKKYEVSYNCVAAVVKRFDIASADTADVAGLIALAKADKLPSETDVIPTEISFVSVMDVETNDDLEFDDDEAYTVDLPSQELPDGLCLAGGKWQGWGYYILTLPADEAFDLEKVHIGNGVEYRIDDEHTVIGETSDFEGASSLKVGTKFFFDGKPADGKSSGKKAPAKAAKAAKKKTYELTMDWGGEVLQRFDDYEPIADLEGLYQRVFDEGEYEVVEDVYFTTCVNGLCIDGQAVSGWQESLEELKVPEKGLCAIGGEVRGTAILKLEMPASEAFDPAKLTIHDRTRVTYLQSDGTVVSARFTDDSDEEADNSYELYYNGQPVEGSIE